MSLKDCASPFCLLDSALLATADFEPLTFPLSLWEIVRDQSMKLRGRGRCGACVATGIGTTVKGTHEWHLGYYYTPSKFRAKCSESV